MEPEIIRRWHIRDQVSLRDHQALGHLLSHRKTLSTLGDGGASYPEGRAAIVIDKCAFQLVALLKTETSKSRKQ